MIMSMTTWIRIGWVGILLALSHGLGNASLNYSPYPLKVAFKSCKLVPTMALGACVTGRRHTSMQYAAALVMGIGLATLTAADVYSVESSTTVSSSSSRRRLLLGMGYIGPFVGPMMLGISTIFDAIIPNLQERLLQISKVKTSDMILVSNAIMCVVLLSYTSYSGELASSWGYCIAHPDVFAVLLVQGACAYLGLGCYLSIIRDHGGVVGVLMANARKLLTIVLSFMLFSKPFHRGHLAGLALVSSGVYLGSKGGTTTTKKKKGRANNRDDDGVRGIPSSSSEKKGGKSVTNRHHEHSV